MRTHFFSTSAIAAVLVACAPTLTPTVNPRVYSGPPTRAAITPGDLKTRLYIYADDSMRGRAAGTPDNIRATAYIESEVRKLGLEPAGENGTYFQNVEIPASAANPHPVPGRNVIAILRGSDPKLRGEYVAFGAHNDHIRPRETPVDHDSLRAYNIVVRPEGAESRQVQPTEEQMTRVRAMIDSMRRIRPPRLDSINNGADDDGTGSMALLEIAESFAKSKDRPKRSLLFVWHTGEEAGLLGSEWFTTHPTVPLDSIVSQLNIDMIGRGGKHDAVHDVNGTMTYGSDDFIEVVGSRKLSTELGDIVDAANQAQKRPLVFSHVFDTPGEPHRMYCRSDHYMYARYGIPITFFFTSVHADYHQVTDEPQYIDYDKYSRIVNMVHDAGARLANLDHRPVIDKPKPDPKGRCVA